MFLSRQPHLQPTTGGGGNFHPDHWKGNEWGWWGELFVQSLGEHLSPPARKVRYPLQNFSLQTGIADKEIRFSHFPN